MKKALIVVAVLGLAFAPYLTGTSHAFPPKKGDKPCTDCHKLDKKEAEALVKKVAPTGNVTVTEVKMSPIKGVWEIDVDAGEGKHGALYLDFSKKYIVAQIVPVEALGKQTPKKVDSSKITLENAITLGPKNAAKKVIVFSDPDCPYCRELHKSMKQVLAKRSDIAFEIILVALPMHKDSPKKVRAILCSKSVEMLDDAFAGKPVPEPPSVCTDTGLEKNEALAKSLDFGGTPTMVRDDGMVHSGTMAEDKLIEWIDKKD